MTGRAAFSPERHAKNLPLCNNNNRLFDILLPALVENAGGVNLL
jgi:hypothetical protein